MKVNELDEIGKPYTIYAENLDAELAQFIAAMKHESVLKGALMPDAHLGYSLPIGGVVACDGVVFPSFVGYDIGCGMCAINTTFNVDDVREHSQDIFDMLYKVIPVGRNHRERPLDGYSVDAPHTSVLSDIMDKKGGYRQLGTLGSGNHFIEIGVDGDEGVWIIIHSGSRGIGHGVATHYMKVASGDGKAREGNFAFCTDSQDGQDYILDMEWCLQFALANRKAMLDSVCTCLQAFCSGEAVAGSLINRTHNHATFRDGMWIHRKGATHAEEGMMGVIPGNMRDGSFIVRGKGNPESLWSSSHGAGRVLGRKAAKKALAVEDFEAAMEGIQARVGQGTLDEAPMAYKDIFEVMRLQADLVEVVAHVTPLVNVKG